MSLFKKFTISTLFASSLFFVSNIYFDDVALATTQQPTQPTNQNEQPAGDPPSGENVEATEEIEEVEALTPASVTGEKMQGTGTIVDYTTSGSKAFYTIVDREQNTFYLIVDMDKTQNNVYFLTDVNKSDLEGINAAQNDESVAPIPPTDVQNPEENGNSGLGFTLIVLLLAVFGVTAYYFLVMRKRHQNQNDEDEMEEYYDDENDDDDVKEVDLKKGK